MAAKLDDQIRWVRIFGKAQEKNIKPLFDDDEFNTLFQHASDSHQELYKKANWDEPLDPQ